MKVQTLDDIKDVAKKMCDLANQRGKSVSAVFNHYRLTAHPGDEPDTIVKFYHDKVDKHGFRIHYVKVTEKDLRKANRKTRKL